MPRPKARPVRSPSSSSDDEAAHGSIKGHESIVCSSNSSCFTPEGDLSDLFERLNTYIEASDRKSKMIFKDLEKKPKNLKKAMFEVLADKKEAIADLLDERAEFDCLAGAELGPPSPEPGEPEPTDEGEYKFQLQAIKIKHTEMLEELEQSRGKSEQMIDKMVTLQIPFRPISKEDHKRMIETSTFRYSEVEERMKKSTVNAVMLINNKCLDARRRRRNFTKETTEILTEWFNDHINHPYPTDEEKNELAVFCNISVQQITNWFGNRRVRQKRQADRPLQPPPMSPKRKDSDLGPRNKNYLKGNRLMKQRRMSSPGPRQLLAVPLQQQLLLQQGLQLMQPLPTASSLLDQNYQLDQFEPQGNLQHAGNLLLADHYRLDHSHIEEIRMDGSQERREKMPSVDQIIGDKSYTAL